MARSNMCLIVKILKRTNIREQRKIKLWVSDVYSDDSDSQDVHDNQNEPKINDYVIVKLRGVKIVKYYIANTLQKFINSYEVRFMISSSETKHIFVFVFSSELESMIDKSDIISVLEQLEMINKRGQYLLKLKIM